MTAITALTLDLDDTLWPILPVIERCERVLHDFLSDHAPAVARRFPVAAMRQLRDRISARRPELAHDYGRLRRASLEHAFDQCGVRAPELIDHAYTLFYRTRNQVDLFGDVPATLPALAARYTLLALTNGNADLDSIGLAGHFHGTVNASQAGCAKPDPRIFALACRQLGVTPDRIWHIGDDPDMDVLGAHRAGMGAVWLNRERRDWPYPDGPQPDLVVRDLAELDDWLQSNGDLSTS